MISSFSVHPLRLLVLYRRGGRGTRLVLASLGRGGDEVGTRDEVSLKSSGCCERSSRIRVQEADRPGESWLPGQLGALSCALDKSDSRLEPCTRPSTCDNVSKLPAQAGCGSSALGVALRLRNRCDTTPEQALCREGGLYYLGRSCWPLLGTFMNRTTRKLETLLTPGCARVHEEEVHDQDIDSGRGSSIQGQAAGFLPAMRQADRSWPGPLCQVPRNAVALWLAAQELSQRPRRRSGCLCRPEGRYAKLRRVSSCSNRFPPDLVTGGKPNAPLIHVRGTLGAPSGFRWYSREWRASGVFSLAPGACRALQVLGLSSPTRVPTSRIHSPRSGGFTGLTTGADVGSVRGARQGVLRCSSLALRRANKSDPSRESCHMNSNELAEHECGAKRKYDKRDAKRIAKICQTRGGPPRHAYRCPQCGRWHVGHGAKVNWQITGAVI